MLNLRKMCVYKDLHNHYVIPMYTKDDDWMCKTFYYDPTKNEVKDQGCFWYAKDGTCLGVTERNVHQMVATSLLHPKIKKAIKEWKIYYKNLNKENNNE